MYGEAAETATRAPFRFQFSIFHSQFRFSTRPRSCTVRFLMGNLLWLIIIILVIMWLGGFALHIGGGLIHILIVVALILLIYRLATGRRVM
jgi:hypothetical protein